MTDYRKEDRFSISADEMHHRMKLQKEKHLTPSRYATAVLEAALDMVLGRLGVNIEAGNIPYQQEQLGIIIKEEDRPEMAGLCGFFVFATIHGELVPYAWIGDAKLNSNGECSCEVNWLQAERMDQVGGVKVI